MNCSAPSQTRLLVATVVIFAHIRELVCVVRDPVLRTLHMGKSLTVKRYDRLAI
jgi:hypothetical protein